MDRFSADANARNDDALDAFDTDNAVDTATRFDADAKGADPGVHAA